MCSIVYQSGNVVFWHLGELFLEDTLETCEDYEGFRRAVVVCDAEFNLAVALFDDCWLFGEGDDIDGFLIDCWEGCDVGRGGVGVLDTFVGGGKGGRRVACFAFVLWEGISIGIGGLTSVSLTVCSNGRHAGRCCSWKFQT